MSNCVNLIIIKKTNRSTFTSHFEKLPLEHKFLRIQNQEHRFLIYKGLNIKLYIKLQHKIERICINGSFFLSFPSIDKFWQRKMQKFFVMLKAAKALLNCSESISIIIFHRCRDTEFDLETQLALTSEGQKFHEKFMAVKFFSIRHLA